MSCAIQPDNADIMYIGSDVAGIHKTTDGGATWTKENRGFASSTSNADAYGIENIIIGHSDYKILYAAMRRDGEASTKVQMPERHGREF